MRTLLVLAVLLVSSVAKADTPSLPKGIATQSEVNEVRKIRERIGVIDNLEDRGVFQVEQANAARAAFYADAGRLAHRDFKREADIDAFLLERQDFLTKAKNLATFTNIVLAVAAIIGVVAITALIGIYAAAILILIPAAVYEVLLYAACVSVLTSSDWIGAKAGLDPIWFVFPACLGLLGALWVTYGLHLAKSQSNPFKQGVLYWGNDKDRYGTLNFTTFSSLVCTIAWGVVATLHQSELIAFITTMAFMSFLGFSFFVAPFCIGLGYGDEDKIPRTTFSAFIILMIGLGTRIAGSNLGKFQVFAWSFIWLGTFVYFCSLLIVANKWYSKKNYWVLTGVTLASGIAALYLGSIYDIPVLQQMGGTFFFIWLTEKYFEIPWGEKGWAWGLLLGSALLYATASFARQHPDYFLFTGVPAEKAGVSHGK